MSEKRNIRGARRSKGQTLWPTWNQFIDLFFLVIVCLTFVGFFILGSSTAYCDGNHAFSPPPTAPQFPGAEGAPEAAPVPQPVPEAVVIPQLAQPLIPDSVRGRHLYDRYLLLNFGGDVGLRRLVNIIDTQVVVERHIEAALVADGFQPNSIMAQLREIRGYIHCPRGELLTLRTYQSYVTQIMERGTRQSVPYRRLIQAIQNYDIILD